MVIDNFLEKITEYNDETCFGTNNLSNREFLDSAIENADLYCHFRKISMDDFHIGKEMFRTIKYFINNIQRDEVFLKGLNVSDLERINKFLTAIIETIEDEEKRMPNFDANIVCESIINFMILLSSIHFEDTAEATENCEKVIQGEMKFNGTHQKKSLTSFNNGEINLNSIMVLCFIAENIGYITSIRLLSFVSPLLGMAKSGTFKKIKNKHMIMQKYIKNYNVNLIWHRYQYWEIILTACYNYYCKNYGGGINE